MTLRVFSASIFTETNTFSPLPTSLDSFRAGILFQGPAEAAPPLKVLGSPWHAWRDACEQAQLEYQQGLIAFSEPAGLMTRSAHHWLREQLLSDLSNAGPIDIVLLAIHGSMMSTECDDIEGDLLQRVRSQVGDQAAIGALIDPHAHLTEKMVRHASVLAAFHEWPHDDVEERALHVLDVAIRVANKSASPTPAVFDCHMVAAYPTRREPMRSFIDSIKAQEHDGAILSASLIHGFPWGNHPETGAKALVWTDGDNELAQQTAREIGARLFELREATTLHMDFGIEEALDHVEQASTGPIVLCDAGDNVPGGGAGDATFLLRRTLERGVGGVCFGPIWDPMATRMCFDAGEGETVALRIGGKSGPGSGDPVDVNATVLNLSRKQDDPQSARFGDRAWVRIETGIDLVLHQERATLTDPGVLTRLGIQLGQYKAIVGKMLMHGGAAFAPLASEVRTVATPGALNMNYAALELTRKQRPWWPKDLDFSLPG